LGCGRSAALRVTPALANSLLHCPLPKHDIEAAYDAAWANSLQQLNESHSHFAPRDVMRIVLEQMQHLGVSGNHIADRVKASLAQSPEIVPLRTRPGCERYSTQQMWQMEERLLGIVDDLKSRPGLTVSAKQAQKAIEKVPNKVKRRAHKPIQEQKDAAHYLQTEKGAIKVLAGSAGTGKSTSLAMVVAGCQAAGYKVVGGALSGAAKEELAAKTGIECHTVARILYHAERSQGEQIWDRVKHHDAKQYVRVLRGRRTYARDVPRLDANTVVIIDEAGMLDSRTLLRLVTQIQKAQATLIIAGDEKQAPPIGAGGPFAHLKRRLGFAELTTNQRQRDPLDKQAVQDIREGRAAEALANYEHRGRITIAKDRDAAIKEAVAKWVSNGGLKNPAESLIFTQTREEARYANFLVQQARQKRSAIPQLVHVTVGQERIYAGDRVLFHTAYRPVGIENGFRGTVLHVDPIRRELTVELDRAPQNSPAKRSLHPS
jgi:ATP-dependent exoDNAse (exonuclease V) alpha subunit